MTRRIRVLVVDDHGLVAEALRELLSREPDFEVVDLASNGEQALLRVAELRPDVVLMDVSMPALNGIDTARRIRDEHPSSRVVVLSRHSDAGHVQRALQAGACGYVLKRASARTAITAIRTAFAGTRYLDPELAAGVVARIAAGQAAHPLDLLSPREREVLQLLAESRTTQQIAASLGVSTKTVDTYRARLMEKLDINDLAGLVRFSIRHGLIDLE